MSSEVSYYDEFDEARILVEDLLPELEIISLLLGDRTVDAAPSSNSSDISALNRRVELVEQILFRIWLRATNLVGSA